jgi:hypothetical protein
MGDRAVRTRVKHVVCVSHACNCTVNAMHLSETRAQFARSQLLAGVVRTRVNASAVSLIQASASVNVMHLSMKRRNTTVTKIKIK